MRLSSDKQEMTIESLLRYYHDEVVPALAVAINYNDRFPEEVLNEIRSALTHMSRAHVLSQTRVKESQDELEAAARHLKRVYLDCLKDALMSVSLKCDEAIQMLTDDIQLPENVYKRVSGLRNRRTELSIRESQEMPFSIINDLKKLLDDYDKFYAELDDQFAGQTAGVRKAARKKAERNKQFKALAAGLIIGLAANFIFKFFV